MKHLSVVTSVLGRQMLLGFHRTYPCSVVCVKYLYTPSALGMDGYLTVRERVRAQFSEMGDRFRTKMKEFVSPGSINMVFTEDLKQMVHLAEGTEEDMELVEQMMVKFSNQGKDLRFGNFIFGPVVMRMYHHLNKPKEALRVFLNPELEHFFDQIISYQILMDLLFENEMYDEVIQVANIVKEKQLTNARFPKNVIVLALAAAYKKNTPEMLTYMKELWAELLESGHQPMRRAVTFAAALAINQNAPHIALEILSQVTRQNYVTLRNLRASALADVNRPDDALPILRGVLEIDGPQESKHTFCAEVIDKVKEAVEKCNKKDVQQEFERILEQLTRFEHITNTSLDSQLCSEIEKVNFLPRRSNQDILLAKFENSRLHQRSAGYPRIQRQGLSGME